VVARRASFGSCVDGELEDAMSRTVEDLVVEHFGSDALDASELAQLRGFPLDSVCGQSCVKVAELYASGKDTLADFRNEFESVCLDQMRVICFG
jgi:hypothetical protein